MTRVPLSVLDLAHIPSGTDPRPALRAVPRRARLAESLGYRRYWIAEHHFSAGLASPSPAVLISAVAAATTTIRVGSGAILTGHRTALSIAEDFCTLDALYDGRIDLGLGRSAGRGRTTREQAPGGERPVARTVEGVVIPAPYDRSAITASPRALRQRELLQQPGAQALPYPDQVAAILGFLADRYRFDDGTPASAFPGGAPGVPVWALGSSGGESARLAGQLGLPFAADYHMNPGQVLDAAGAYRQAFHPGPEHRWPYLAVAADVYVAETAVHAREVAAQRAEWVRRQRSGGGLTAYPTTDEAVAHQWTDAELELVADRTSTHIAGVPEVVVERLAALQRLTGAAELIVTMAAHDSDDVDSSLRLLAEAWHS
ncbi:putative monooxygenase (luciferase-like) [Acrocarpospora pleiomorpha]|uniref:Putative monooxygenase (Luciferase-like) n=1 Tax=Acrocarpospora pleiomorpha TaxID=90975 RepID=A0A5M3XKI1_9ACTN|nr:LLM class flavin-dependent oxidoreductase [Acrocarpospora pleiomorpha]GES21460.1 putative monooxygenase (luciferase-like) [Acrocarpospora pleiomorpha]